MSCLCNGSTHHVDCSEFDVWEAFDVEGTDGLYVGQDEDGATDTTPSLPISLRGASSGVSDKASKWSGGLSYGPSCKHTLDAYTLNDGTTIYLSSKYTMRDQSWDPDYSVYLDDSWSINVGGFTTYLPWQDFGLPTLPIETVVTVIAQSLAYARNGMTVEVACLGSHGRTGTFVAIMELLASDGAMTGAEAIKRVRSHHCDKAVESKEQEAYVSKVLRIIRKGRKH